MHRTLMRKIISDGKTENMEKLECVMVEALDYLKMFDEDVYDQAEYKLYKMAYGDHLSRELAEKWVGSMKNDDGTIGGHWTYEQTSQHAGSYDKNDWYAVLNMIYSDNYMPKFETSTYIDLAKKWFEDKDARPDKTLRYYWYVSKD